MAELVAAADGSGATPAVVAALIAALAALAVGLLNYVNQGRVLREQRQQLDRQLAIAREGQLTERFTRAVEQLGNDRPDVRLGGIYALEQIAHASDRDRPAIAEVLTAFVQGHAPWPPRLEGQPREEIDLGDLPPLRAWAPDVQAAITVLGRRASTGTPDTLDLSMVDLRRAELSRANLENAILRRAGLHRVILPGANLRAAALSRTLLERADLRDVQLESCVLRRADLRGADLGGANLTSADLEQCDLRGAILGGADLRGARLTGARLEGAVDTASTSWPESFDASARGVTRRVRA